LEKSRYVSLIDAFDTQIPLYDDLNFAYLESHRIITYSLIKSAINFDKVSSQTATFIFPVRYTCAWLSKPYQHDPCFVNMS